MSKLRIFKLKKIREISPAETTGKFLEGKAVSAPQKRGDFFKENDKKTMISALKTLKKFKNIESPKMVSKRLYGHYLRSYEQFLVF